jgi:hypothetical protein
MHLSRHFLVSGSLLVRLLVTKRIHKTMLRRAFIYECVYEIGDDIFDYCREVKEGEPDFDVFTTTPPMNRVDERLASGGDQR